MAVVDIDHRERCQEEEEADVLHDPAVAQQRWFPFSHCYMRCATRSLALRDRGFCFNSLSPGMTGFFVIAFNRGFAVDRPKGSEVSSSSNDPLLKKFLTSLSSRE